MVLVLFLWGGKAQINAVFNAVVGELGRGELTPGVRPNSVSVEVAVCARGRVVRLICLRMATTALVDFFGRPYSLEYLENASTINK